MRQLTPLKAIRARCVDCSETRTKVRECPFDGSQDELCLLHPFRMGRGRARLRDIRAYCLWCCVGQSYEVKLCPATKCPLWIYRFGKRPQKSRLSPETRSTEGVLIAK